MLLWASVYMSESNQIFSGFCFVGRFEILQLVASSQTNKQKLFYHQSVKREKQKRPENVFVSLFEPIAAS